MIHTFKGITANDVWKIAAKKLKRSSQLQKGRGGETQELLHAIFYIHDPRQRWVLSREPAINPAFALAEVVWMLNGQNDAKFLNNWNSQLPKFAGSEKRYHGAYGFRLRKQFRIDQLERAYYTLRSNPSSRQVILQIWDPNSDFPEESGEPRSPDIPCNIMSILKVRNNRLEWTQIMRSNDLFKGTPYNFIQFTTLQEIIAGWLGVNVGSYVHLSDSLHFYLEDWRAGSKYSDIEVACNTDHLSLPKNESETIFSTLYQQIQLLASLQLSEKQLDKIVSQTDLPTAYKNIILVMAAETARKKKWLNKAHLIITKCTNLVLTQAWQRWCLRHYK